MWRVVLSNTWLNCLTALAVMGASLWLSLMTGEGHWFQRSGSIVVIFGVLVSARRVVRLGSKYMNEDWNLPDESPEGRRVLLDERSQYIIGPSMGLIDALICGYGDLLLR